MVNRRGFLKRFAVGGAAAVVMFSLFEEQIKHENAAIEHLITSGAESFAESLSFFPALEDYETGPDEYLNLLRRATEAVDIPVIGSLNGIGDSIGYVGALISIEHRETRPAFCRLGFPISGEGRGLMCSKLLHHE